MNKEIIGQEIREIFNASTKVAAQEKLKEFISEYQNIEPRLAKGAEENIPEGFTVYDLEISETIRKKLRTSNLCERINQEIARRSKIIRVFPNEASCLRIASAILMEIDEEWSLGRRYFRD